MQFGRRFCSSRPYVASWAMTDGIVPEAWYVAGSSTLSERHQCGGAQTAAIEVCDHASGVAPSSPGARGAHCPGSIKAAAGQVLAQRNVAFRNDQDEDGADDTASDDRCDANSHGTCSASVIHSPAQSRPPASGTLPNEAGTVPGGLQTRSLTVHVTGDLSAFRVPHHAALERALAAVHDTALVPAACMRAGTRQSLPGCRRARAA